MNVHYLKTIQPFFNEVRKFKKKFEIRKNDRDFKVGDEVYLQEYDPKNEVFSGLEVRGTITYVLTDFVGLNNDYCIFSFNVSQFILRNPH